MMNKKQRQKPELIVLVRGKPEEAVLTACKGDFSGSASSRHFSGCSITVSTNCDNICSSVGSS
jgi:hypothetical protein